MRPAQPSRRPRTTAIRTLALAATILAAAGGSAPAAAQQSGGSTVLLVSDLHFDPFAAGSAVVKQLRVTPVSGWAAVLATAPDTAPSAYGDDSNYPLLRSAGAAMQRTVPSPAFVVITGDFLAHNFDTTYQTMMGDTVGAAAFADSTMAFMASWIGSLYATAPIYPSIGNNDSDCGDYTVSQTFLRSAARAWAPLAQRGGGAPGFLAAFDTGGYYVARPPASGLTLVMLNDIYWSRKYSEACGPDHGARELAWLGSVLAATRAEHGRAWLAAHIPPGADAFSSLSADSSVMMFASGYVTPVDSTIRANADVVALQLTGHTHMSEFRVYTTPGGGGVPDVGVPAVSPVFDNNPGFVAMRLGTAGEVLDYGAYVLPLTTPSAGWQPMFSFGATYHQTSVTGASLRAAAALIAQDSTVRAAWLRNYTGGGSATNPNATNWHDYWCAIQNLEPAPFSACAFTPATNTSP